MAIITISKESGCGDEVCRQAAQMLGYKYLYKEMVHYAATLGDIPPEEARQFDEQNYSHIYSILSAYLDLSLFSGKNVKMPEMTAEEYARRNNIYAYASTDSGQSFFYAMEKVIRMLANEGNVIIVGRGGNFLLMDNPDTLHMRLVAPLGTRTDNISRAMTLTVDEAAKHALSTDKKKKSFIQNYFGKDVADPLNYHMLLNLGMLTTDQAVKIIVAIAQYMEEGKGK